MSSGGASVANRPSGGTWPGGQGGSVVGAGGVGAIGASPSWLGGAYPVSFGGYPSACLVGNPCSTPYEYCLNGYVTCQCLNGIWGSCYASIGTGGVWMATGGVPSSICAVGAPCSTPYSSCINGSLVCQCLSGVWQNCYVPGGAGGAPSTTCAYGYSCPSPGTYCLNGNMECQCLSGYWQNCYVPGGAGGAPSSTCALGNACYSSNSFCSNGNVECQCMNGVWQACRTLFPGDGGIYPAGGAPSTTCAYGYSCPSPGVYCLNGNTECQCVSGYWQNCSTWNATGGTFGYGGARPALGGYPAIIGGRPMYTGGARATTGGVRATGGLSSTGGTTGAFNIATDGYAVVNAGLYVLHGVVYSFAGGSSSSITLSYDSTSFCARGVVGANPTYVSWAGAGFNVNQSNGGAVDSLILNARGIIISFKNATGSPLRLQLNDAASNNWCYELGTSSGQITIPLTSFNTHCWDNSGSYFAPGTTITTIQMVVPGDSMVDRPFDFCMLGVEFR